MMLSINLKDGQKVELVYSIFRLWRYLCRRRKIQFILLLVLILLSAFAEILSLGAVIPFLTVLISPQDLFNGHIVAEVFQIFAPASPESMALPLTVAFMLAAIFAGASRVFLLLITSRISYATGADLSLEVYRKILYCPYKFHLSRNSGDLISSITNKVNGAVISLYNMAVLISAIFLLCSILSVLILTNSSVALAAVLGFGGIYFVISRYFRNRLMANSMVVTNNEVKVIKSLQEGLSGIKDVLIDGTQNHFLSSYQASDSMLRRVNGDNIFIAGSPRFIMESLGMSLIALFAFIVTRDSDNTASIISTLAIFSLGAQRILPLLQQSFTSWVSIVANHKSLKDTLIILDTQIATSAINVREQIELPFNKAIRLENIYFSYDSLAPWTIEGLTLTIPKGVKVGIVGSTGCGKSTALDLLMGLLEPLEGQIWIDDKPLAIESHRAWQKNIAHVPQAIYLADSTIAENIAFGVSREKINLERVRWAANQACIASFIESCPESYNSRVGERGVFLSGGQRQRIGIARALYKQASVLIFDEATSALDDATEKDVMSAIDELDANFTILIVAHRVSTLKHCDLIVEIAQGKIILSGDYDFMSKHSNAFIGSREIKG